MRSWNVRFLRALAAIVIACLLVLPAVASGQQFHFELMQGPGARDPVPPDGSTWHELHPVFCTDRIQSGYEDNGDGLISACDYIWLDGLRYHIDWVGPTYHLADIGPEPPVPEGAAEPEDPLPGEDPTGEPWHWVYPPDWYCTVENVEGWEDNGDTELSPCDIVAIGGRQWHVVEMSLNIEGHREDSPVEQSTWSRVKSFFKNMF